MEAHPAARGSLNPTNGISLREPPPAPGTPRARGVHGRLHTSSERKRGPRAGAGVAEEN
jgi:hypothetical protein